ncbi:MAG: Nramp family divalent metal transporter [bacterium]|nr:Nramp family divalent metal transporter [bacterium]
MPPTTFLGRLRRIGPGIIISGAIVGSGELIVTTKLGAEAGFALLWLILFSCVIKVFLQIELGRYVVSSGHTVLEAFDRVPGPALRIGEGRLNWLNVLWFVMTVCAALQIGGILLSLALVFAMPTLGLGNVPGWVWALPFVIATIALLASGRYRLVEGTTTTLVCLFTLSTLIAAMLVQTTSAAITGEDLVAGLTPAIPPDGVVTAFAVLGITGVGANELVFYPYWCLDKGYARHVGPADGSPAWLSRARGWVRVMQLDAWMACLLYTVGTVAFYLLGAAVLHRRKLAVDDDALHESLSQIYTAGLGDGLGTWVYAIGAVAVLFSTYFVWAASGSRVVTDAVHVFGIRRLDERARRRLVGALGVGLPLFAWLVVITVGRPVALVFVGAVAQAAMLPFIALAVLMLRYRETRRELAPRSLIDPFLWIAALSTALICVYQFMTAFGI